MVIVVQWLQNCSSPQKSAPLPSQFKILSRQALKQVGQTYNLVHLDLDLDLVLFFGNIPREKYSSAKIRSENDSLPLFSISWEELLFGNPGSSELRRLICSLLFGYWTLSQPSHTQAALVSFIIELLSFLDFSISLFVLSFEKAFAIALQHCFRASWQSL